MLITERIDFLYVFNYDASVIDDAVIRLRCSIKSIASQNVRICICNTSAICIHNRVIDLAPDMKYIHTHYTGPFSKALGINYGVKHIVSTPYFILSDVDLVYSRDHIQRMMIKCDMLRRGDENIRFIFYNYNLLPVRDLSQWNKIIRRIPLINRIVKAKGIERPAMVTDDYELLNCLDREPGGFAHGNGLIHTETFYKIKGYDEEMIGYGPEDGLFNLRISKVNRIIYDNLPDTASFHLWHPKMSWIQVQKNHEIAAERVAFYNSLSHPTFDDVCANKGKTDWGVI
jgi:predicted glycosyltransferase involved in capsule biosynthesis